MHSVRPSVRYHLQPPRTTMASLNDAPADPAPAAPDVSQPVGLEFRVTNFSTWMYRVETDKKDHPNAKRIKEAASTLEVPAPQDHGHKFDTLRYLFTWDKHLQYWALKHYAGKEGNIISIEEFLEARGVKELVENKAVCDSIVYYDGVYGNEIDEATAFEWSKTMHPSKKPPSQRPGKRAMPASDPAGGPSRGPTSPAKEPKKA